MKRFLTTEELIARGWTRNMVKRLLRPDRVEEYTANRWRVKRNYYSLRQVSAVERSKAFQSAKMRCKAAAVSRSDEARERREQNQYAGFTRKYGSPKAALADACEAMFNLNRYAKHRSCTGDHAAEIYRLKHDLIRLLYTDGYCVGCHEHVVEGKKCFKCDGTGFSSGASADYDDEYDGCERCGGSGLYKEPKPFVVFRFGVAKKNYCWHVPRDRVNFEFNTTAEESSWEPTSEEKPINIRASAFARAKTLIRWVLRA